jgi:hypothetical protein
MPQSLYTQTWINYEYAQELTPIATSAHNRRVGVIYDN